MPVGRRRDPDVSAEWSRRPTGGTPDRPLILRPLDAAEQVRTFRAPPRLHSSTPRRPIQVDANDLLGESEPDFLASRPDPSSIGHSPAGCSERWLSVSIAGCLGSSVSGDACARPCRRRTGWSTRPSGWAVGSACGFPRSLVVAAPGHADALVPGPAQAPAARPVVKSIDAGALARHPGPRAGPSLAAATTGSAGSSWPPGLLWWWNPLYWLTVPPARRRGRARLRRLGRLGLARRPAHLCRGPVSYLFRVLPGQFPGPASWVSPARAASSKGD